MSKELILGHLKGSTIADIILSEKNPSQILTIILEDGHYLDVATCAISHPKREKEMADFLGKLSTLIPESHFTIHIEELSIEEMRNYASDHAKKINANGGNVTQIFNGQLKISMGEDLAELRRTHR